ncbi:acyl carrier protein [Leminorella grimontii]|uniref:Acyl carrier protein n=1 Tax=Leminorella grimontii TaxID=82981 RepID=A0AAV5N187_9GAMM|nr:phosphopantetheine-binding protein [Leminorella grimontii]KFC93424.1 acyl carrier protein [Leminorella grimontii ATCC 33999 = DSM 5078]GKX55881.1 acyl carrier protein [Leminorella grimontii]VFS54975.1 acyl carrier protein [Leminorella grimontii]
MDDLAKEIKTLIIEALNLEGMTPDDIETDAPLFGDGLGLDSIDALELGLAIKNRYGVILSAESEDTRKHFYSVASLSELVASQRG